MSKSQSQDRGNREQNSQISNNSSRQNVKNQLEDKTSSVTSKHHVRRSQSRIGHRRVDHTGNVTYKKTQTSDLMNAIQYGILQSTNEVTMKPKNDILYQDFTAVEQITFGRKGTKNELPFITSGEVIFKTYASVAFRYFRELFGITKDDFLTSICTKPLVELSNPGASGSVFFKSYDDEFVIKTVQKKESKFLRQLLAGYYMNLTQNHRTFLPKFYGHYCIRSNKHNIRIVIMNNLIPSIRMDFTFDLKGSTFKRTASNKELTKSEPTYKDLDFKDMIKSGIRLSPKTHHLLSETINKDCRVLSSFKIMDYSLLLGIHIIKPEEETEEFDQRVNKSLPNIHEIPEDEIAHVDYDSLSADDDGNQVDGPIEGTIDDDKVTIYMGLIDILQNYRASKKLEHGFKSILFDGKSISVTEPTFYEKRFTSFLSKFVFTCEPTIKVLKRNSTKKDLKRYSITTSIKIKQESNKILSFVETPPPPFTADKQSATSSIKISNVSTTTKLVEPTFNEDEHSMTIRF